LTGALCSEVDLAANGSSASTPRIGGVVMSNQSDTEVKHMLWTRTNTIGYNKRAAV